MREFAQSKVCFSPVVLEDHINTLPLVGCEPPDTSLMPAGQMLEAPPVVRVESGYDGTIGPGFDARPEEKLLFPSKVPSLRIVEQLVQAPRAKRTFATDDVLGCVMNRNHRVTLARAPGADQLSSLRFVTAGD